MNRHIKDLFPPLRHLFLVPNIIIVSVDLESCPLLPHPQYKPKFDLHLLIYITFSLNDHLIHEKHQAQALETKLYVILQGG